MNEEVTRYAVCDYGTRHMHLGGRGFEECNCQQKFGVPPFIFDKHMRQMYPNRYEYPTDITFRMQQEYLNRQ